MSEHRPPITKEIPAERWMEWCDTFTNGNRGRSLGIRFVDEQYGAGSLAERAYFVAIDHDPVSKGNDFIISYGDEESLTSHVIRAPVTLWQVQDANGVVVALAIGDQNGRQTIARFD